MSVGAGLSADYTTVKARLAVLERLLTDLDAQLGPVQAVGHRQGPGMWGTVPSCTGFAATYQATLDGLHHRLLTLRSSLASLHTNLAADAAALAAVDDDTRARLIALADRFAAGPPQTPGACTVYDAGPDATTPTPTPAPAPAPTTGRGGGW